MPNIHDILIAHRGASIEAPENTLTAIKRAWEQGAKRVECDIHLTSDKRVVLIHDADTLRVSGVMKIIRKTTLAELKLLDVGSYKGDEFKNERIPELSEVLPTIPIDGRLVIEIKCGTEVLPFLKAVLSEAGVNNNQIEFIAFNRKTLALSKQWMPEVHHFWLLDLDYGQSFLWRFISLSSLIRITKKQGFSGVNVWAGKALSQKFIFTFHQAGLKVYCWTVNDAKQANELYQNGIDAITTDYFWEVFEELSKLNK
ncbi:MAG: glycerophosphodiester phosphodiesterase [Bacteroidetes bacterium HGW-Bacteroidetes-4]|nr:MAG: glycerophosphodiester phosphodiesterase [Bacteroidetes bacterium HGW-Bacteroidetes-4]